MSLHEQTTTTKYIRDLINNRELEECADGQRLFAKPKLKWLLIEIDVNTTIIE